MRIEITRRFTFEAAHQLSGHCGACNFLHGHSYQMDVTVRGPIIAKGSSEGMIIDFSDLKKVVKEFVIDKVDHKYLNDVFSFRPTAEGMVEDIFRVLTAEFARFGIEVTSVKLWETADAYAEAKL